MTDHAYSLDEFVLTVMTLMKLGLLDCGEMPAEWLAEHGSFAQWFIPFLNKAGQTINFQIYDVLHGEIPAHPDVCDAWLITGSADSVYDDLDWLNTLKAFLRQTIKQQPIVGICFGHQLLHHLLGGRVERSSQGWCIGTHHYQVIQQTDWMQPQAATFDLLASHQDQVIEPAPDSVTLAQSTSCPIAMSVFGDYAVSMQPHPELLTGLAEKVFRYRRDEQGHKVTDQALASLTTPLSDTLAAQWIINFLNGTQIRER
ncbi:MAG: glutamine amidotransferase-related protein [Thiolinea sp.]